VLCIRIKTGLIIAKLLLGYLQPYLHFTLLFKIKNV